MRNPLALVVASLLKRRREGGGEVCAQDYTYAHSYASTTTSTYAYTCPSGVERPRGDVDEALLAETRSAVPRGAISRRAGQPTPISRAPASRQACTSPRGPGALDMLSGHAQRACSVDRVSLAAAHAAVPIQ